MPTALPVEPVLNLEIRPEEVDDFFDKEPPTPTNDHPPPIEESPIVIPDTASDPCPENGHSEEKDSESSDTEGSSGSESEEEVAEEKKIDCQKESNLENGKSSDFDSDSDTSEPPVETLNRYVQLTTPNDECTPTENPAAVLILQDVPEQPNETDDGIPDEPPVILVQQSHPQLAVQEDFDLSPHSETRDSILNGRDPLSTGMARARSKESVDSLKFAMTETEFSDWADNSLAGDLDGELDLDPEPAVKEERLPPLPAESPSIDVPSKPLVNGTSNFDDIEFADDSEGNLPVVPDFKGYTPLVEEVATPDKPTHSPVIE